MVTFGSLFNLCDSKWYGKCIVPAAAGFLLGGVALRLIDAVVPHLHLGNDISKAEGIQPRKKKLSKTALLFLAITIHNFPEGLAVGVTFGALAGGNMTLRWSHGSHWSSYQDWFAKCS